MIHDNLSAFDFQDLVACKTYFDDVEGARFLLAHTEGSVGPACLMTNLKSMNHSARVVPVNYVPIFWVKDFQFNYEIIQTFSLEPLLHLLAYILADCWNVINPVAYGINIHHRATREESYVFTSMPHGVYELEYLTFKHGRRVIVAYVVCSYEVMPHSLHLLCSGCGSSNWYLCINLS